MPDCHEGYHRNADLECIKCPDKFEWNETQKACVELKIFGREYPQYSYVYNYTNKTTGNITYPEYEITTTKFIGGETYQEQEGWQCPCDMEQFTTGEKEVNKIVEQVAKSVAEQQKKLDDNFYRPMLADPSSVPVAGDPEYDFLEEEDVDGYEFVNADGGPLAVETDLSPWEEEE